jgi:hypothetical protein
MLETRNGIVIARGSQGWLDAIEAHLEAVRAEAAGAR